MRAIIEVNVKPIDYEKYFVVTVKTRGECKRAISINEDPETETLEVYPNDKLLYKLCEIFFFIVKAKVFNP